ncbi:LuxR C-terminal-related transcriptional regulator [Streptomyces sp. NPDC101393]|uniref:LuxR C-terminal-related transcriptional regulator n=1 Tax=Streptomyces sp. NPDC101393 TaxID=3366141 RepID=UPI0037F4F44A
MSSDGAQDFDAADDSTQQGGARHDGAQPGGAVGGAAGAGGGAAEGRTVRVVLVDDHRMFRTGVQAEIGETGRTGVEVVGEAADVDQAVTVIAATRPEVVLLDVHLPGGGGVEVLRRSAAMMADADRPVRFLALSVSDAAEDVIGVIRGGARGYVTKTITGTDLVNAIFRVADGDAVFSPRLAGFVLDAFASTDAPPVDEDMDRLTQREREVLRLIARGYAYKEIAKQLFISVKTVESHVSAVLRKLQLSNRHELTRWATARRLV